jgi:16S rRNA (adenine1518-N6/adenine1519-N6)-dimethyltransferase
VRKKKFLGQHFLHDQRVLSKIITAFMPKQDDYVVEIGPGEGALTTKLLPFGCVINAIEIDLEVIPRLKENCKRFTNLHIFAEDVLAIDFLKFSSSLDPIRLIGNLPYNISTPLLFKAIEYIDLLKDMHFMLQKEVAERIIAAPGSKIYGRLSVMLQYYCEVELLFYVGSGAFSPPPKVDSAVIKLVPRKQDVIKAHNKKLFSEIVRTAFCQRRKIIANSLKQYITSQRLEQLNLNPLMRPEQLQVADFVAISNAL